REFHSALAARVDRFLQTFDLAVDLSGVSRTDIGLDHQRYPGAVFSAGLCRFFDDGEAVIPFAFDRGEHRVRSMRQPGPTHDLDGRGPGVMDRCVRVLAPTGGD